MHILERQLLADIVAIAETGSRYRKNNYTKS